ncbi:leucyl aminopeptidase [Clostridium gasigenes]|uniref:Probable cytosol aminopeptidase n=1 Tax=Clostridium gasigenes TaxID=94869 RepID=A0A7X0SGA8_9CLOT|nr:leucyl aminopeptidase [Clostridium gasigenes]MBB6715807.1 leucyl aminopeptidase [Clostridium gasigenes]
MKVGFKSMTCAEVDALVVNLVENKLTTPNEELNKSIKMLVDRELFAGKEGEVYTFTRENNETLQTVILVGLGKEEKLSLEDFRKVAGNAIKKCIELKLNKVFLRIPEVKTLEVSEIAKAMTYGAVLGNYTFDKYKTSKKEAKEIEVSIGAHGVNDETVEEMVKSIQEGREIAEGVIIARNLVNEPSNVLYPETLANEAIKVSKESGFDIEVFGLDKIKELKMEAFYEVSKGSEKEPKLIVMRYFGNKDNKEDILGLVGKGLTYDSGGYSIKPTAGMDTMKSDMGGAAAVIGAMSIIAKRKLKINVVTVIASCENLISGNAYKPGEIIGSMAGKTIEVLNTDAEGRLTLADAVHYIIEKENAKEIIDVATLTGAALVALGETTTAVITNNSEFYNELKEVSDYTGEKVWELPAFDDYKKLIKSDIADLKNIGGKFAGTITAGLFIKEFVQDKPWLHLDIAGTSWSSSKSDYGIKGGTGAPVSTLYELAKKKQSK